MRTAKRLTGALASTLEPLREAAVYPVDVSYHIWNSREVNNYLGGEPLNDAATQRTVAQAVCDAWERYETESTFH